MSLRPVVCVDLDHTLIQTDITQCARRDFIRQGGFVACMRLVLWSLQGLFTTAGWMATLKNRLAQHVTVDVTCLPYDPVVLEELLDWKNQGHHMVLATGAPWVWAQYVNDHLKIFDDVFGTQECNFIGSNKARTLVQRYGEKGFMYYGDSVADLEVWPHACSGVAVNPRAEVRQRFGQLGDVPMRILETPLKKNH